MRLITATAGLIGALFLLTGCTDITPGGSCSSVGSKHTNANGYSYTCVKNDQTGKLFWSQDKPLKKDRP